MSAQLTFCGGAGEVTGASTLVAYSDRRILIDCGLLERSSPSDTRNAEAFPFDPASIDVLLVTHAHQDHIGRIPKLVRDGFKGRIISTEATRDIARLMFDDALYIMEAESRKVPGAFLYEQKDVAHAMSLWDTHPYLEPFALGDAQATFLDAGHVLGSAMIRLTRGGRNIVFTGDLGNSPEPLLNDTESPEGANILVMESVYGDRLHEGREGRREALRESIEDVRRAGGVLLIPSFSLERTQVLLSELNAMLEGGQLAPIPIYLDSPLSIRITDVYRRHADLLNDETRARIARGDDPFSFKGLALTPSAEASRAIRAAPNPKIIIAGAGMSYGGRIRDHEKHFLPSKDTTILFVGYQAAGSLGRRIQDGARHVDIDGECVVVRARVRTITGYSGHPDREQLLSFVERAGDTLEQVFVTMGEPSASGFLAQRIRDFLSIEAVVPEKGSTFTVDF